MEWIENLINSISRCNDDPGRSIQRTETKKANMMSNLFDVVKPPKLFHADLEVARPSTNAVFSGFKCFFCVVFSGF